MDVVASDPSSSGSFDEGRFIPGTLLAGRYRIVGPLGRGGMGEVYRANDLKLGQPVALKFLPAVLSRDGALLARFHNEVRVARQVSHPNVCRVYDIGEVDGQHYISMEYVDGEDLGSLLRRIGRLPADKAIEIARQLCAGLAAAHDKGVLHRDLKPANVMIDGRGKVLITDFGLAGLADQLQGTEVRAGTPAYMAPEQLAGREVSVKSDLYSLGLVLYEIFVGKPVYKGASIAEIARSHEEGSAAPTSPSQHVEGFDPAVERVILRCLEKDPRHRPASALAVAAALPGGNPLAAALAAGETPSPEMVAAAGEIGALRPAVAWACLGAVVAGAILLVALGAGTNWSRQLSPENPPEALASKARDILNRFGYTAPPADSAYAWSQDYEYLRYIREHDKSPGRWDNVFAGRPPALSFWYRQSPRQLEPWSFFDGVVNAGDPPDDISGMVRLTLDPQGRLSYLRAVPPQVEELPGAAPSAAAPAWAPLFEAAGMDQARFEPTESQWMPLAWGDARAAWKGSWPGRPDVPVRIEAAAYRGKPIYFEIVAPWSRAERMQPFQQSTGVKVTQVILLILFFGVLAGGALIARRNLKLGRGDRRGAFKIAAFTFSVSLLAWALGASHVPTFYEFWLFIMAVSWALFVASFVWVLYVALEPYVRRRWPDLLISWSRLLAGRLRDPRVGRDLLVGAIFALVLTLVGEAHKLILRWSGFPADIPFAEDLRMLLGIRQAVSSVSSNLSIYMILGLGCLFVLFILRVALRRQWLAALAFVGIFDLPSLFQSEHPLIGGAVGAFVWTIIVVMLVRFGLVALIGCFFMNTLMSVPITLDPSAWFFGHTLVGFALVIAIAAYGFHTALAGQPLFKDKLFQE